MAKKRDDYRLQKLILDAFIWDAPSASHRVKITIDEAKLARAVGQAIENAGRKEFAGGAFVVEVRELAPQDVGRLV